MATTTAAADRSLIASAFGPSACFYADVLRCDRSATAAELKKAYYRRALAYHPDKMNRDNASGTPSLSLKETTLRFQAVSAAYEILMDPGRRALYDKAGPTGESDYETAHPRSSRANNNNDDDDDARRWDEFFQSVFREVVTTGAKYDNNYRGSHKEAADVLEAYRICKGGNWDKMESSCIIVTTTTGDYYLERRDNKARRWVTILDGDEPAVLPGLCGRVRDPHGSWTDTTLLSLSKLFGRFLGYVNCT
jgi:hypothetical protein